MTKITNLRILTRVYRRGTREQSCTACVMLQLMMGRSWYLKSSLDSLCSRQ